MTCVDFPRNFAFLLGNKLFVVSGRLSNRYWCFSLSAEDSMSSWAETWLTVYRALGSLARRDGDCFLCRRATWLVETEIAFFVEQQYFSRTTSVANCGKSGLRIFEKYFHKNGDISSSCGQILMRSFQSEAFCMQI